MHEPSEPDLVFCCNKRIERACLGATVHTPATHTPVKVALEGAALPPGGAPRPILLALWEAFEKEQVLQACLARPTPGYRWPETILSPDGQGPL